MKVTEGTHTFLDCRFFGSPVPELRWWEHSVRHNELKHKRIVCVCVSKCVLLCFWVCSHRSKYGQGNLEGSRFKTHANGTLEIKQIRIEDQGTYLCVVSNVAGRDESQVRIEVKGRGRTALSHVLVSQGFTKSNFDDVMSSVSSFQSPL